MFVVVVWIGEWKTFFVDHTTATIPWQACLASTSFSTHFTDLAL